MRTGSGQAPAKGSQSELKKCVFLLILELVQLRIRIDWMHDIRDLSGFELELMS